MCILLPIMGISAYCVSWLLLHARREVTRPFVVIMFLCFSGPSFMLLKTLCRPFREDSTTCLTIADICSDMYGGIHPVMDALVLARLLVTSTLTDTPPSRSPHLMLVCVIGLCIYLVLSIFAANLMTLLTSQDKWATIVWSSQVVTYLFTPIFLWSSYLYFRRAINVLGGSFASSLLSRVTSFFRLCIVFTIASVCLLPIWTKLALTSARSTDAYPPPASARNTVRHSLFNMVQVVSIVLLTWHLLIRHVVYSKRAKRVAANHKIGALGGGIPQGVGLSIRQPGTPFRTSQYMPMSARAVLNVQVTPAHTNAPTAWPIRGYRTLTPFTPTRLVL